MGTDDCRSRSARHVGRPKPAWIPFHAEKKRSVALWSDRPRPPRGQPGKPLVWPDVVVPDAKYVKVRLNLGRNPGLLPPPEGAATCVDKAERAIEGWPATEVDRDTWRRTIESTPGPKGLDGTLKAEAERHKLNILPSYLFEAATPPACPMVDTCLEGPRTGT
jgi:hypothetical protein